MAKKSGNEKNRIYVILGIVIALIALGITAEWLYPETTIGKIINETVGKFFNLARFFELYYVTILESMTIIFFMWVLAKGLTLLIRAMTKRTQRSETVGIIFSGILRYGFAVVAVFLILGAWGVEAPTLLAGAGILGLAISFGAQSLIEDILSGLFIISEKQFSIGDVIEIDNFRGKVIAMSIRTTKFENIMGDIKIVNNSDIRGAINTSSKFSPAICDIAISYNQDIEAAEKVIYAHLEAIAKKLPDIKEGPFYRGIQSLSDSSVVIRIIAQTFEDKKYQVTRDLNREMKILFDKNNIKIPFPQLVVHLEHPATPKEKPVKA